MRLLRKRSASTPAPSSAAVESSERPHRPSRFRWSRRRRSEASADAPGGSPADAFTLLDNASLSESSSQGASEPQEDAEAQSGEESKRKVLVLKSLAGTPVYLEDTGEKIGVVFDTIIDKDRNLVGYKIKDSKSDTILSFSLTQFLEDKDGLIFIPSWYSRGVKTVEKLEFKDRITPELQCLVANQSASAEELFQIFVRHDDSLTRYLAEAAGLRDQLNQRLAILERERAALKESLMDITEKRLIQDIDRREFSDIVTEHRRKVNVLDANIKKSKDLLGRLQKTSFGTLSLALRTTPEAVEQPTMAPQPMPFTDPSYQERYSQLRQQYSRLQEGYEELKTAVERLLSYSED